MEWIRPYPVKPVLDISKYEKKCMGGCSLSLLSLIVLPCDCIYCYVCYKKSMNENGSPCECDIEVSRGQLRKLSQVDTVYKTRLFTGVLYGYQQKIVEDIDSTDRVVLSLDMGLGKTIVSVAMTVECNKIIIIVPVNLITQWTMEIDKFIETVLEVLGTQYQKRYSEVWLN